MGGNTAPTVSLRLLPRTPVSRVVAGEVLLNADLAEADGIESIILKLRGKSKAQVKTLDVTGGLTSNVYASVYNQAFVDNRVLVKEDRTLWTTTSQPPQAYPDRVISLPFEFDLPEKLIPTIERIKGKLIDGQVYYYVKVIAKRKGRLKSPRRIKQSFIVLDSFPLEANLADQLRDWQGPWRTVTSTQDLRRTKTAGTYQVQLSLPEVPVFPLFKPILIKIEISHRLDETGPSTGRRTSPIILPQSPLDIKLTKEVKFFVQADKRANDTNEVIGPVAGFKDWPATSDGARHAWSLPVNDTETLNPAGSQRQAWSQQSCFQARLVFNGLPSVNCYNFSAQHRLVLEVPSPAGPIRIIAPYELVSGI